MSKIIATLPFEKDIQELEAVLDRLQSKSDAEGNTSDEVRSIRRELTGLIRKVYNNLTAWDTVLVSRHPERPQTTDYIRMIFDEFVEFHGDRAIGDDRAIRAGFARLGDHRVLLIGHQKGHDFKEKSECLFGCAHPEGYRKALAKMKLAAKFKLPIICLIDTPGACRHRAEQTRPGQLIATNLLEMARLETQIICVVIGEGGSGGALGIGIGDRVSMLRLPITASSAPKAAPATSGRKPTTKPSASPPTP